MPDDPYERQLARQAEEARLAAERKAQEEVAAAEEGRLSVFREYAEAYLLGIYDVPTSVKAQALVETRKWITSATIPKGLSQWAARQLVENQVAVHLKPHYDAVARAKKKEDDTRSVEQLIRDGNSYAQSETFNWEWDEKIEARKEVDEELRDQVEPTWTITDVKELVNDVLYEDAESGNEGGDSAEDDDQER